jgi:hypothetical protein
MPFKSKAQQRFMFSQHPEMAKEWADKTPDISKLPEHVKKMADGGDVSNPESSDFERSSNYPTSAMTETPPEVLAALAAMTGGAPEGMMEPLGNEAGEISLGGNAPEMEDAPDQVQAFIKGVQKNPNGADIKIWGVKGPPEILKSMFGDEAPGSVPEAVLKEKGILPSASINVPGQTSPNTYAFGGETNPKKETVKSMEDNPTAGFAKGGEVKKVHDMKDIGKLDGLKSMIHGSTDPAGVMGYDDGGEVDPVSMMTQAAPMAAAPVDPENGGPMPPEPPQPQSVDQDFINKLQTGTAMTPPANPISQTAQSAQSLPPTSPGIYQGITADQRAALMQQLLASKASPGNLAVSGIAGLGDAVSNAFGKGGNNFQGNIQNMQNQNIQNKIGVIDTQRQQRLQDLQANLAQQENDPTSAYSSGMRQLVKSMTGKQAPSGASASQLKSVFPDIAKIMDSQLVAQTATAGQKVEAQKAGAAISPFKRFLDSIMGNPAEEALQQTATGGQTQTSNGPTQTTPSGISYTVSH